MDNFCGEYNFIVFLRVMLDFMHMIHRLGLNNQAIAKFKSKSL